MYTEVTRVLTAGHRQSEVQSGDQCVGCSVFHHSAINCFWEDDELTGGLSAGRNRTDNPLINSQMLYQLSYEVSQLLTAQIVSLIVNMEKDGWPGVSVASLW